MSENTTTHEEVNKNLVNGGQPAGQEQPAATAAEPKNNAQPEQPAPAAPTKVEEPAAPSSPHAGFIARAKENWDVAAAGAAVGLAAGLVAGAICFGGKKEEAAVVV